MILLAILPSVILVLLSVLISNPPVYPIFVAHNKRKQIHYNESVIK